MSPSIGKNIRKLRKERNLTQEELAELLGITSQAVSKWENETGMPDISQLVPLASVFGVSADMLLGIEGRTEEAEVQAIIDELHGKNKRLEIDDYENYKQGMEALAQYPNNFQLLYYCFVKGSFLLVSSWRTKLSEEEQEKIYRECIRQSEVIFAHCRNIGTVINTKRELIGLLTVKGEREKALQLLRELPNSVTDVSDMMMARYSIGTKNWSEAVELGHKNIYELLRELQHQSKLLASAYMRSGQYDRAETVCLTLLDMMKAIYREETYTPPLHIEQPLYRFLAICALRREDEDGAVEYLEAMCQYTLYQAEGFQKIKHLKTPMLESYEMEFNYPYYEPKKTLLAQLEMSCFQPLRDHPSFLKLMEKVQKLPE